MTRLADGWEAIPVPPILASNAITAWQKPTGDGHLTVFAGQEGGLWHLSISHRLNTQPPRPGRNPRWDEIKSARYRFCPDDVVMAMLLGPPSGYINVHSTTFHLWQVDGPRGTAPATEVWKWGRR